jgi:hypothetical protein
VPVDQRFSLRSAFAAKEAGGEEGLASWVGQFLASPGSDNEVLAAALAERRRWWLGPLRLPIDRIVPLAGPEDEGVLCPIDPEDWESDVEAMEEQLEEGWEPPPLLIEYQDGRLLLQDGNHRRETLERAGVTHCWVIIWFDDPADRVRFTGGEPPS